MHKASKGKIMIATPAADDRFAQWGRLPARLLLAAVALILIASALVPIQAGKQETKTVGFVEAVAGDGANKEAARPRDDDLALYDRVIQRIGQGENYYAVAAEEHRKSNYPLRPGVAVRLPTLAYLSVWLGDTGRGAEVLVPGSLGAALVLLVAVVLAWWRRLGEEPGGAAFQRIGTALMFMGASLGLNRYYFVLHELWAGMLIALSLALHRPGKKWLGAVLVAGLALAIREHVLPYVLLMGALALWRRDWKESAAWAALVAAFGLYLAWHLGQVAQHVLPSDPMGPAWLELRGLSGWLSNVVLSSNMRFLPHFVAGPLVMLMVLGWAGWKSPLGTTATLLYLGYGLAFMIAGRPDNFYWGAVIAPAMFVGLAFAPRAVGSLAKAAK
jgi:hypothetical protein